MRSSSAGDEGGGTPSDSRGSSRAAWGDSCNARPEPTGTPLCLTAVAGVGASVLEILNAAKSGIDANLKSAVADARSGDPAQILANVSLAGRDLEWDHRISIQEMVLSGWNAWNPELI